MVEGSLQRVLVVDDDDAVRSIVAETLRGEGYHVNEANNGAAALEQLQALAPDVILLDIVMRRRWVRVPRAPASRARHCLYSDCAGLGNARVARCSP